MVHSVLVEVRAGQRPRGLQLPQYRDGGSLRSKIPQLRRRRVALLECLQLGVVLQDCTYTVRNADLDAFCCTP